MELLKFLEFVFIFLISDFKFYESICYFPTTWYQSTPIWQDSHKGQVFIFDTFLQGWRHQLYDVNITRWNCYILQTDLLVIRSQTQVSYNGTDYTAYGCMAYSTLNSSLVMYSTLSGSLDDFFVSTNNDEEMCSVCTKDKESGNIKILSSSGNPSDFLSLASSNSALQTFDITNYCPNLSSTSNSTEENSDNVAPSMKPDLVTYSFFSLIVIIYLLELRNF